MLVTVAMSPLDSTILIHKKSFFLHTLQELWHQWRALSLTKKIETFILHLGVCSNILFKNIMTKVKDKINVLFCLILFTFLIKLIFWKSSDLEVALSQSGSLSTWFLVELEFENVGFWGEGKRRVPGEKPLGAKERTKTNSNHIWHWRRDLNPGHMGGRQELSPLRHPVWQWHKNL